METSTPLLVTEKELATLLNISWQHLVNLRKRRLVPFVRLGKSVRYSPTKVAKALEKLTVEEHTPPAKARR